MDGRTIRFLDAPAEHSGWGIKRNAYFAISKVGIILSTYFVLMSAINEKQFYASVAYDASHMHEGISMDSIFVEKILFMW